MNEISIFLYQHPPMGGVQKPCFGAPQVPSILASESTRMNEFRNLKFHLLGSSQDL